MNLALRSTYVFMFTATVVFGVYGWWVFGILGVEYFTGPDALIRIGKAITILIIGGYAFEILTVFTWSIFNSVVLKHTKSDFIVDERDKQILYKSMYYSHLVLCTGLFLSVGALALGWSAFWVFNLMVLAFLLSVVAELTAKVLLNSGGA